MPLRPEILQRKTTPKEFIEVLGLKIPVFEKGAAPLALLAEISSYTESLRQDGAVDLRETFEAPIRILAAYLRYAPDPADRLSYEELMELPLTQEELREIGGAVTKLLMEMQNKEPAPAQEADPNSLTPSTAS